jgi:hypothetical protein
MIESEALVDYKISPLLDDTGSRNSADVELPSKTAPWRKRRRKLLLWILGVTIGVVILRELGAVSLECLTINLSGRIDSESSAIYWEDGRQRYTSKDKRLETTATEQEYKIGFDFPLDSNPGQEIDNSIKKRLAESKYIDVLQVKSKISGIYSLPLFKDGEYEFSLVFGAKSPSGKHFDGELTGVMSFNIKGVCSQRKLRELLSSHVANDIVKAIESNIRD